MISTNQGQQYILEKITDLTSSNLTNTITLADIRRVYNISTNTPLLIEFKFNTHSLQESSIKTLYTYTAKIDRLEKNILDCVHPIIITQQSKTAAMWETSASQKRTEVTLICNPSGFKKKAIYVTFSSQEFTSNSALIPIEVGDYVIKTTLHKQLYTTYIYQIKHINIQEIVAALQYIDCISDNPDVTKIDYKRAYECYPHLRPIIRSSKHKSKKGKTYDIHFAEYSHLLTTDKTVTYKKQ